MAGEGNNADNVDEDLQPSYHSTDENYRLHIYPITKIRLVVNYMTLVARLLVAAYVAWLRNQRHLVRQLLARSASFSALSRVIAIPCGRIRGSLRWEERESEGPEKSVDCEVLYDPGAGNIRADVIFIHGLHGSLHKTWRQGDWDERHARTFPLVRSKCYSISKRGNPAMVSLRKQPTFIHADQEELNEILNQERTESQYRGDEDDSTPCWPRDWLPVDCPGVRVIALNYTTDPFLWRPIWVSKRLRTCMVERSREMMEHLQHLGVGKNPIVWVGHSKGGLFIKRLIVDAYNSENTGLRNICLNTKAIMFYSVPHHGSPCADINLPLLRKSVEVTEVERGSPTLMELHQQFLTLINSKVLNVNVFSFIETIQTCMSIFYLQIVAFEAADPGVGEIWGVSLDHRDICKPRSRKCFLYRELANLINRTV